MAISRSALDVEWQRLQIIAQNLANQNTTRTATGGPYRPLRLLSGPSGDFSALLAGGHSVRPLGVQVMGVVPTGAGVRQVREPGHPHADANGMVSYPAINNAAEMATMIQTARAYEANVVTLSIASQMYSRALQLGRG